MRLEGKISDQSFVSHMISVLFQSMIEKDMHSRWLEIHFFDLKERGETLWF